MWTTKIGVKEVEKMSRIRAEFKILQLFSFQRAMVFQKKYQRIHQRIKI